MPDLIPRPVLHHDTSTPAPARPTDLEQAAQDLLTTARAVREADQELEDANAAVAACGRAVLAAQRRAEAAHARLRSLVK